MKSLVIFLFFLFTTTSCAQEKASYSRVILEKFSSVEKLDLNQGDTLIVRKGKLFTEEQAALVLRKGENQEFTLNVFTQKSNGWREEYIDKVEFGLYVDIDLSDINKDGIKDIVLRTLSGEEYDMLYLSDGSMKFMRIDNINSINLLPENEDYIYTYLTVGCADSNWESELISFKGTQVNIVAKIEVDECFNNEFNYNAFITRDDSLQQIKGLELESSSVLDLNKFWIQFIGLYLREITD